MDDFIEYTLNHSAVRNAKYHSTEVNEGLWRIYMYLGVAVRDGGERFTVTNTGFSWFGRNGLLGEYKWSKPFDDLYIIYRDFIHLIVKRDKNVSKHVNIVKSDNKETIIEFVNF